MSNQPNKNKLSKNLKIVSIAGAVVMCSTMIAGATKTSATPKTGNIVKNFFTSGLKSMSPSKWNPFKKTGLGPVGSGMTYNQAKKLSTQNKGSIGDPGISKPIFVQHAGGYRNKQNNSGNNEPVYAQINHGNKNNLPKNENSSDTVQYANLNFGNNPKNNRPHVRDIFTPDGGNARDPRKNSNASTEPFYDDVYDDGRPTTGGVRNGIQMLENSGIFGGNNNGGNNFRIPRANLK